jgi:1-acyl-sn-glycerol-3-phosphate acyltransferase
MHDFESIRPYRDQEVPAVVRRLLADPTLSRAAAPLVLPRLARLTPPLAALLTGWLLRIGTRRLDSIADVQDFLASHMRRLIEATIAELEVTGIGQLEPGRPYLFISNHRDILMDTALLNYVLYEAGLPTPEAAVGDNLLGNRLAADLMRLNKSFVVERDVEGKRAAYRALTRTSNYIRSVLENGDSVWIAQREGRAKDGFDRTDPAVLKMLALAWRKDVADLTDLLQAVALVPVAISYELDPCDRRKAHELAVTAREGAYRKAPDEDLTSILEGMQGFKGRVHVHFAAPVRGDFQDSDELALAIDRDIVMGLEVFPTQAEAARQLGFEPVPETRPWLLEVRSAFEARLADVPADERGYLLAGYGNLIRNRAELSSEPGLQPR